MDDLWARLRTTTQARIGLGRAGNGTPTAAELSFRAAHAAARDAVHRALDVRALREALVDAGVGSPVHVRSRAVSRSQFLRRPDLGREPLDDAALTTTEADVALVLVDGLSPGALTTHGVPLAAALRERLAGRYRVAAPVVVTEGRVAIGDHIGAALGVRAVLVLIGERPGLSVAESIGLYLTYAPRPGRSDAERNCVSNVHPPDGLGYAEAADVAMRLLDGAAELGTSGVRLKDRSRAAVTTGRPEAISGTRPDR